MISSPKLTTILLYDVLRRWSLYLNRCVAVLASEALDTLRANAPFTLDPMLLKLDCGRSVGPILLRPLPDLLVGWSTGGNSGGGNSGKKGGGGGAASIAKVDAYGGSQGYGCDTVRTCLTCPFGEGRTRGPYWKGQPPPNIQGHDR